MIASTKRETPAHDIRHDIADAVESSLDLFGRGRTIELPFKIGGLRDYRFSVTVENAFVDYYFTEKLIDCFLTGTVPMTWARRRSAGGSIRPGWSCWTGRTTSSAPSRRRPRPRTRRCCPP